MSPARETPIQPKPQADQLPPIAAAVVVGGLSRIATRWHGRDES